MSDESDIVRLLMVDDEEEFLDSMARALTRRGFEVSTAPGAKEALRLMQKNRYDVAVLDVKMPGMDGVELFRRLRASWPWLPVVMLTGHGTIPQAFETSREGVVDYLTKPCSVEALEKTVRDAVTRSESADRVDEHEDDEIRVLVVDDDEDLLSSLSKVLTRRNMRVCTAMSGEEALVTLSRAHSDVVVLDIKMPGMGGLEALRRIKAMSPKTEVLLLTGHPSTHNAFVGIREGAFDYLLKPHGIDELARKIRAAYRHRWLLESMATTERVSSVLEGKAD
jgi:DNA-binding NtrC family response regulator